MQDGISHAARLHLEPIADTGTFARYVPFGDGRQVIVRRGAEVDRNHGLELGRRTLFVAGQAVTLFRYRQMISPPPLRPGEAPMSPEQARRYTPEYEVVWAGDSEVVIHRDPDGFSEAEVLAIVAAIPHMGATRTGPPHAGAGAPPDLFAVHPDPKTEVRRCAKCGQAAMLCVRVWKGVSGAGWVTRECICQSCGAKVRLVDPKRIRALRITGWIMIWAIVPTPILLLMAHARKAAWARHPLAPNAPFPAVRHSVGEADRRCGRCGDVARAVSVSRHRSWGIPAGTEARYACGRCGAAFKVEGGAIVGILQAAALAACGIVAISEAPEEWQRLALGPLAVLASAYLAFAVVRDLVVAARNPKIR